MTRRELTVRVILSPIQWGEAPGNLRFSVMTGECRTPIGGFSLGGMAAYRLQEKIAAEGPVEARVICASCCKKFVLRELMCQDGWKVWTQALNNGEKEPATVLVDEVTLSLERRSAIAGRAETVKIL